MGAAQSDSPPEDVPVQTETAIVAELGLDGLEKGQHNSALGLTSTPAPGEGNALWTRDDVRNPGGKAAESGTPSRTQVWGW